MKVNNRLIVQQVSCVYIIYFFPSISTVSFNLKQNVLYKVVFAVMINNVKTVNVLFVQCSQYTHLFSNLK